MIHRSLFFILLCGLLTLAHAQIRPISDVTTFQTMSTSLSINPNDKPTAIRTVTFRCPVANWGSTSTPYQVTDSQGRQTTVTVTCNPLSDRYTGSVVGYIPSEGILHEQQVCSRVTSGGSDPAGDLMLLFRGATSAELLSVQGIVSDHRMSLQGDEHPEIVKRRARVFRSFNIEGEGGHPHMTSMGLPTVGPSLTDAIPLSPPLRLALLTLPAFTFGLGPKFKYAAIATVALPQLAQMYIPKFITSKLTDGVSITMSKTRIPTIGSNVAALGRAAKAIRFVTYASMGLSIASTVLDILGTNSRDAVLTRMLTQLNDNINTVQASTEVLADRIEQYNNASSRYFASIQAWSGATTETLRSLTSNINDTNNLVLAVQNNANEGLNDQKEALQRQTLVVQQVASYVSDVSDRATLLSSRVVSLNSLVNQISDNSVTQLRTVMAAVNDVANQTQINMNTVVSAIADVHYQMDVISRDTARTFASVRKAIVDVAFDSSLIQSLTYMTQIRMTYLLSNYSTLNLAPFVTHYGALPNPDALQNADGLGDSYIAVEIVTARYIGSQGTGLVAYQDTVSYECAASFLIKSATQPIDVRDMVDQIGPSLCATNTTNPSCRCRMRIRTSTCTLAVRPGYTTSSTRDWYVNSGNLNSTVCLGGVAPSSSGVQLFYNATDMMNALGVACNRGLYAGTGVFVGSSLAQSASVTPVRTYGCVIDYDRIENGTDSYATAEYLILMRMFIGLGNAVLKADSFSYYEYGLMPGGVTFKQVPADNDDGDIKKCWTAAFMSYKLRQSLQLPVISYTRTSSTAAAIVNVEGIAGNPVTEIIVGSRSAAVVDSFVSVGFPDDDTIVYDIPQALLPITQNPITRAGTVTYPMLPTAYRENFNASSWVSLYGMDFDAYMGSVTADKFAYRSDPATRLCTTPVSSSVSPLALDQGDSLCRMRQHGRFSRSTQSTASTSYISYTPTESGIFYDVAVTFPVGTISSVLFSGCPIVTVIKSSPILTIVQLTNPVPSQISFSLEIEGGCPDYRRFSLVEGGSLQFQVPICSEGNSIVKIRRILDDNTDDVLVCEGGEGDVSVDRVAYITDNNIPDTTYVQHSSEMVTNQAISSMITSVDHMIRVTAELTHLIVNISLINNLAIPQLNLTGFATVMTGLRNLGNDLLNDTRQYEIKQNSTVTEYNRRLTDLQLFNEYIAAKAANRTDAFWELFNATQTALQNTSNKVTTVESLYAITQTNFLAYNDSVYALGAAQLKLERDQNAALVKIKDILGALDGTTTLRSTSTWVIAGILFCLFPIYFAIWGFCYRKVERCISGDRTAAPMPAYQQPPPPFMYAQQPQMQPAPQWDPHYVHREPAYVEEADERRAILPAPGMH